MYELSDKTGYVVGIFSESELYEKMERARSKSQYIQIGDTWIINYPDNLYIAERIS